MEFNWTLKNKKTIYENVKCNEYIDIEYINGFLNDTERGVVYGERDQKRVRYQGERMQYAHYHHMYNTKDKVFNVKHKLPEHKWGRIIANKGLTLSTFHRETRHGWLKDNSVDFDMVNCHQEFLCAFATHHDIKCDSLKLYCKDPKAFREIIIDTHLKDMPYKQAKEIAKKLPITMTNGGSYKSWLGVNKLDATIKSKHLIDLEKELADIGECIVENNPQIAKDIKRHEPAYFKQKGKSDKKTVIALWCQTIERFLQEEAIQHLSKEKNIPLRDIVPCQDGFLIRKCHYSSDIVDIINKHVNEVYPYNTTFIEKPFDCAPVEPLPRADKLTTDITDIVRQYDKSDFFNFNHNNEYIDQGTSSKIIIDDEDFDDANTILQQAGTGVGKTKEVTNRIVNHLKKNPEDRVLCLSNMISIVNEMAKKFKDEHKVILNGYGGPSESIIKNNSYICINSIDKLYHCDFSKTILFIDEPTNVFMNFNNNDTIRNKKLVFATLIKMIKGCKKLIMTDAHFTSITTNVLKIRKCPAEKLYYYVNKYKKFKNHKAFHYKDENNFLNELQNRVRNGIKFIFATDCKATADKFHDKLLQSASDEDKKKFVLITKDTAININDVDVNDSFIFMSPKITCGVSIITNPDVSIDTFVHANGKSISPITMFQQATRNRCLKSLHFYCEQPDIRSRKPFETLDDCAKHYVNNITQYQDLMDATTHFNDEDDLVVNHESFYFTMFIKVAYITKILMSDIKYYFTKELINVGFEIETIGDEDIKLEAMDKKEMKQLSIEHNDKDFDDVDINHESKEEILKNHTYYKRAEYLGCLSNMKPFKNIIMNDSDNKTFTNFERMMMSKEKIQIKLQELRDNKFEIDVYNSDYNKLLLLREYEEHYKINALNLNNLNITFKKPKKIIIDQIKQRYRLTKCPVSDVKDIESTYIKMLIHLCKPIMQKNVSQKRIDGKIIREYTYKYSDDIVTYLKLLEYRYNKIEADIFENKYVQTILKHIDEKHYITSDIEDKEEDVEYAKPVKRFNK